MDATHVYWTDAADGTLVRANLDGTRIVPNFITGLNFPYGVAVNATHLYWTNDADGTNVDLNFITGANDPAGIAVYIALPPPPTTTTTSTTTQAEPVSPAITG